MTVDSLPELVKRCICDEMLTSVNKIGINQRAKDVESVTDKIVF